MPGRTRSSEVGSHRGMIAYGEVVRLKHLYGVSAVALFYRLRDLGIVSEQTHKGMFRKSENPRVVEDRTRSH